MSDNEKTNRPAFSAPLYAFARQGAKELSQALKAFPDSLHPVEEPGTLGNPTMQMITEQMRGTDSYEQFLDRYAGKEHEEPQREQELER